MSLLLPLFEKRQKWIEGKKKVDSMQQFRLIRKDFDGLAQISWVHKKKEIERKYSIQQVEFDEKYSIFVVEKVILRIVRRNYGNDFIKLNDVLLWIEFRF